MTTTTAEFRHAGSRHHQSTQRALPAQDRAGWWLPELDGLRAVACLAVVFHHTADRWFENVSLGGMGVSLFFSLSGFLIFVISAREHARTGKISLRRFYLRRILRIWPLYFVLVVPFAALFG